VDDILGHVSVRVDDDTILIRSRGPHEQGLRFTQVSDIQLVTLAGRHSMPDGYAPPNELALHLAMYAGRPDVRAVVHAHPPSVVALTLTSRALLPLVGAFNIPGYHLAAAGVPNYPSSALIATPERGADVAHTMGSSQACLLTGHGLVTTGSSVPDAVIRALAINSLADMTMRVLSAGVEPRPVDPADAGDLPDLGPSFNQMTVWRYHLARLDELGLLVTSA